MNELALTEQQRAASLDRRRLLACGAGLIAAATFGPSALADIPGRPPGDTIHFKVFRKGAAIGDHTVSFHGSGDALEIEGEATFAVGLGPITLFRYHHTARERWSGGRFESLETQTNSNGKMLSVRAQRMVDGVRVEPSEGAAYMASASALPLTHWNRQIMSAPLFNPQDGKMLRERGVARGREAVMLADGRTVGATHYSLAGETPIDDWYDDDGVWAALSGKVKDGSVLTYRRMDA